MGNQTSAGAGSSVVSPTSTIKDPPRFIESAGEQQQQHLSQEAVRTLLV